MCEGSTEPPPSDPVNNPTVAVSTEREASWGPLATALQNASGETGAVPDIRRFVIQQHDATRLHWDLRLEHEGTLRSWALPRGLPWNPKENRLAVATEDHSLDFLDHEGDDFDGQFGAGRSTQWDVGTYEVHKMEPEKVVFTLHGKRASGKYSIFSMRGSRDWLIHRMDPPDDEQRAPVPYGVIPMTATAGDPFALGDEDRGWDFEREFNGVRAIVTDDTGRVVITDVDGTDISLQFPEVRRIGRALGHREVILDGVLVPVDPSGEVLHDRSGLDRRLGIRSDSGARNASRTGAPVVFAAFDILWMDGQPLTSLPWELRRRQLDDLRLHGPGWQTSPLLDVDEAMEIMEAGTTGIVAKRRDSPYTINESTADWIRAETNP
jgi:bifunctional non-homologous end joining protein LigD